MYLSIVKGESIASKENLVGDVNSSLINKGNNIIGHSQNVEYVIIIVNIIMK